VNGVGEEDELENKGKSQVRSLLITLFDGPHPSGSIAKINWKAG
jgi:hypothetical protein